MGIAPFYLVLMWDQVTYPRKNPRAWWPERIPMAALIPYTFASIAIPDIYLTWWAGGAGWTVGGAGWKDGLLRFWRYLMPAFAAFRALADFGSARDHGQRFDSRGWLIHQLSPWPPRRGTQVGV